MHNRQTCFSVGDRVFFWSGRGSEGYGIIREIRDGRAFLDPEPGAVKGSDYRMFRQPAKRYDSWAPRDYSEGRFIVIAPALNLPVLNACRRYEAHLAAVDERAARFGVWTLEALIAVLRDHGDAAYADSLYRRYCDWSLIDDEIEASFPEKLAG